MEGAQACCAVRLTANNGMVQAELTGDHFPSKDSFFAKHWRTVMGMCDKSSPLFLVPDPIVKMAWRSRKSDAALKLSSCQAGKWRKPCGECSACERARDEFFTHMIINAIEMDCEFAKSVKGAVLSVLGGTERLVPSGDDMNEEEFNELFEEMQEHNNKEKNNEAH